MAIHAITGKPGGGKSLEAMRLLVEVLRDDLGCQIVTNLPIKVEALNAFVQKRYPTETLNVVGRITLLEESAVHEFWRHRGNVLDDAGCVVQEAVVAESQGVETRYTTTHAVVYFLDEFHLFFNAREWAKTGKSALWYASQHRKLGDDVYWVTQYLDNVDKQFRVLTQDYTFCRNWGAEMWWGWIRGPAKFQVRTTLEPPTNKAGVFVGGSVGGWSVRGLDKELADCYDTLAGQGVRGAVKPAKKKKGVPALPAFGLALVAIVVAVVSFPLLVGKGIAAMGRRLAGAATVSTSSASRTNEAGFASSALVPFPSPPVVPSVQTVSMVVTNQIEAERLTGYLSLPGHPPVWFTSQERTLYREHLKRWGRRGEWVELRNGDRLTF